MEVYISTQGVDVADLELCIGRNTPSMNERNCFQEFEFGSGEMIRKVGEVEEKKTFDREKMVYQSMGETNYGEYGDSMCLTVVRNHAQRCGVSVQRITYVQRIKHMNIQVVLKTMNGEYGNHSEQYIENMEE